MPKDRGGVLYVILEGISKENRKRAIIAFIALISDGYITTTLSSFKADASVGSPTEASGRIGQNCIV